MRVSKVEDCSIRQGVAEKQNQQETYLKELAHQWYGLTSLKPAGQAGPQAAADAAALRQNFLLSFFFPQGNLSFCSSGLSTDWTRPTHTTEGNVLYLKSVDCRRSPHAQNSLTATPRLVSDGVPGCYSLAKWTHDTHPPSCSPATCSPQARAVEWGAVRWVRLSPDIYEGAEERKGLMPGLGISAD